MRIKWFSLVRITGLVFVLTYHFFENKFPGGFIGVDVFFTFSGFLITTLMIDEFAKKGNFGLIAFYKRRLYRIFPPVLLMVLLALPLTFLISPDFTTNLGKQIAATLGFTTNFFEIATGGSYEANFIPHIFVHTWSLAVEMHFYIIWGFVAFLMAQLARKSSKDLREQFPIFRLLLLLTSFIFFLISFGAMVVQSIELKEFSPVYFSSVTHSFPFFIGSLVGVMTGIKQTTKKFARTIQAWSKGKAILVFLGAWVLMVVLGRTLKFNSLPTYLFGFLAASILAVTMIYAARVLHEKTTMKEPFVLTFLSDISYGVYLFHWPLFIVFSHLFKVGKAALLTTVLSIILAAISYYLLEPLLAGHKINFFGQNLTLTKRAVWAPLAGVGVVLLGTTVFAIVRAPSLSSLETQLWVGNLYQNVGTLEQTRALADAAPATEYNVPKGVSVIGDSVTLGTSKYIQEHVTDSTVDAKVNRNMQQALEIVVDQQQKNILREYVVIAVGTNPTNTDQDLATKIIQTVGAGHRIIFVTPHDGNATSESLSVALAAWELTLPDKYAYVTIADWNKAATAHPEVFTGTDGTHFAGVEKGDELYSQTLNDAIKEAGQKSAKTTAEAKADSAS